MVATGGAFAPVAFMSSGMLGSMSAGLLMSGLSMEMGAVADALTQNRGMDITDREPAAFRQIIYGEQRVGGTMIYESTTGSHYDQYNMVIVIATHEVDSILDLYLDGRKVYWQSGSAGQKTSPGGTVFGGQADGNDHIGPTGLHYNFGGLVYCEARFGNQAEGDVITGLTANDPTWAADSSGNTPWVGGCTYVYLKVEYDSAMFPTRPQIQFTVRGKNDILDPRTGTTGYTTNSALIVADMITNSTWGLNDSTVNQDQLIAAANVCDEQVTLASGSTESRYCCHWHYDTSVSAGDAIAMALKSCGGRISRIGGEWYIWPAYWQAPSFTCDESILAGNVSWTPFKSLPELSNRVNGTYTAANYPYNVSGDLYDSNGYYDGTTQNTFPLEFQPQDYPQYACDQLHGYGTGVDVYLTEDGGIPLPMQLDLPCVLSVAQAQRLAKYALLRNRQQGRGTIPMSLAAFGIQPTDVIQFTFSPNGWVNKQLEVQDVRFRMHQGHGTAPFMWMEVEVGEIAQSVDEWAVTEELPVTDVPYQNNGVPYTVPPVTGLTIEDDSTTVQTLSDGTTVPRMLVSWTPPTDVYVNTGGHIEVQYQYATDANKPQPVILSPTYDSVTAVYTSPWVDAANVSGDATFVFINGISPLQFQNVNVRVRAVRANGATSAWAEVDNHPLQVKYPIFPATTIQFADTGKTLAELEPAEAGADVTAAHTAADTTLVNGVPSSTVNLATTGQQRNLIPDSDLKFTSTYWVSRGSQGTAYVANGVGADGGNAWVYPGTGAVQANCWVPSATIEVVPGQTYTLSGYIDATNCISGTGPEWAIYNTAINSLYANATQALGQKGRVSTTWTCPSGVTQVVVLFDTQSTAVTSGTNIVWSNPQLEIGDVATSYKSNYLDDLTGYLKAGASQIDLASSIHLNKTANYISYTSGGTVDSLKPAQAGADVTSQNGNVLLQNPNLEAGNTGWTLQSGWSIAPNGTDSGVSGVGSDYYLRFHTTSALTSGASNNQSFSIRAGNVVQASCLVLGTSGSTASEAYIRVYFYNASGTYLGGNAGNAITTANDGWYESRVVMTAPADSTYAVVDVAVYSGVGSWAFSRFQASILPNSLDEVPDGTTYQRPLYIQNGVYTTSKGIAPQGSIASVSEGGDGSICSAQCNDSQITVTWEAFDIFCPDGTTYSVPANSTGQTFTGLAALTTYYFAARYNIATQLLTIALVGTAPASLQYQVQTVQADGYVGVAINFTFQTTSSTTASTGNPTPPPTGTCFSPESLVEVGDGDAKPITDVQRGDLVPTLAGTLRPVFYVSSIPYKGKMCVIPGVGLVTPTHQFWDGTAWVDAQVLYPEMVDYEGTIHNLHIDATCEDEHSYTLANGQIVHNIFTTG